MAFGAGTINSIGGAVSDLFSIDALHAKARGTAFERDNYNAAAGLADKNAAFTRQSTAIQGAQLDRTTFKTLGGQEADIAGAGFANSGSALDIMRDSAAQGALTKAVSSEQGLITEEGYKVQADSFRSMASAAQVAIDADSDAADKAWFTAGIKGAAAIASIFT